MEQYTILINKKSVENELINNPELDIDYCCKSKNKLTVYAKDLTIKSLQAKGYNFIKTPIQKLIKNKSINKTLGMYHHQNDLEQFIKNTPPLPLFHTHTVCPRAGEERLRPVHSLTVLPPSLSLSHTHSMPTRWRRKATTSWIS